MSQEFINPSDGVIRQYLATSKTLAVVGLSDREETTSNRVTKEMQARGYKIIPVNPKVAGGEILGEKAPKGASPSILTRKQVRSK